MSIRQKMSISIMSLVIFLLVGLSATAMAASYSTTIYQAQKRLADLGYNPGAIDGIWGKKTEKAVKEFQRDNDLLVTGELDRDTKDSLGLQKTKTGTTKNKKIQGQLSQTLYVDPKGYFRIVPPSDWRIQEYPQEQRGKVAFIGPESAEFRVLVNAVDYDFETFISWCKDLEKRLGTPMNIERITFDGKPAIRRTYLLKGIKFYAINFFIGKANHNLQYGAPPAVYDKYFPIVSKSMETYEPHLIDLSAQDVKKLYVAKKLHIAQLMMEMGNIQIALKYIEEGLEVSPNDHNLLNLKKQIENKHK